MFIKLRSQQTWVVSENFMIHTSEVPERRSNHAYYCSVCISNSKNPKQIRDKSEPAMGDLAFVFLVSEAFTSAGAVLGIADGIHIIYLFTMV